MASYLKPRRGDLNAISATKLLAGEIFFETPKGVGGGKGRLMMGDGTATYANLRSSSKYFLDVDSTPIAFSSLSTSDSNDLRTLGNSIKSDSTTQGTLPHLIRVLQRSLANIEGRLTKLNNDFSYFEYTLPSKAYSKGKWTDVNVPIQSVETHTEQRITATIIDGTAGYIGYFLVNIANSNVYVYNANTQYDLTDTLKVRIYYYK